MANESIKIKKYLAYIPQRLAYLKIFNVKPSDNEYKYYLGLYDSIKGYLKSHKVFALYITGKINIERYKAIYNVSERTAYRLLAKKRKKFIDFLKEKETELLEKYPFEKKVEYE